jgi:hypothetical protein
MKYTSSMKPYKILLLLSVFICACSFRQEDEQSYKGIFTASIDGKAFQVQEDQMFRGLLMNKPASMDGKIPARTVISTTFNGPSYNLSEEKLFNESVQFEMSYETDKLGQPAYYALALQYASGKYYLLKDQSKLTITQFTWESDKKHFRISADYDCKMRSWESPSDGKKDIALKGKMTNIRITVPSWLTAKN